ncbi:MAG: SurA N-terminal domain-containing protein [Planctomycetia bacterium]
MTRANRLAPPRLLPLLLAGALLAPCAAPLRGALAEDPPAGGAAPGGPAAAPAARGGDLPPGVIARIRAADGAIVAELTSGALEGALVQHVLPDLKDAGSAPLTILREMVEEQLVRQEAQRLGLAATDEEVSAYAATLDRELRTRSGGQQTLEEKRKQHGMSWETFRESLRVQILKEEVAAHAEWLGRLPPNAKTRNSQVIVVVTELHKRARLAWHVPVAEILLQQAGQDAPVPEASGALVSVNGAPITRAAYGRSLYERLSEDVLKEVVDKECTTKLLQVDSVALDEAAMEDELRLRERNWLVQRTLQAQPEWQKVGYEEFLQAKLKRSRAEVKADRYYRSFYGLVRRERARVSDEMIAREWEQKRETSYGPAVVVDALQVGFERKNALLGDSGRRDRAAALALAHEVLTQVSRGQPFDLVAKDLASRQKDPRTGGPDSSVRSGERRITNTPADQILWQEASKLKDGEISPAPVETLSEVHLMRRKRLEPGKQLADVKDVLRESIAGRNAQEYVLAQAKDPQRVQLRLPIRTP